MSTSGAKRKRPADDGERSALKQALAAAAPRTLEPLSFLKERAAEMTKLESLLGHVSSLERSGVPLEAAVATAIEPAAHTAAPPPAGAVLSQPVPRHMRRRTNSHQRWRMPERLRMQRLPRTAAIPDADRPREHRRKPSMLRGRWADEADAAVAALLAAGSDDGGVACTSAATPLAAAASALTAAAAAGAASSASSSSSSSAAAAGAGVAPVASLTTFVPLRRLPASHGWHGKRCHMQPIPHWHHVLPVHRNDIGVARALAWAAAGRKQRAQSSHLPVAAAGAASAATPAVVPVSAAATGEGAGVAVIHDASYWLPVDISGPGGMLLAALARLVDPAGVPPAFASDAGADGTSSASTGSVGDRSADDSRDADHADPAAPDADAAAAADADGDAAAAADATAGPASKARRARVRRAIAKKRHQAAAAAARAASTVAATSSDDRVDASSGAGTGAFAPAVLRGEAEAAIMLHADGCFPEKPLAPVKLHWYKPPRASGSGAGAACDAGCRVWVHTAAVGDVMSALRSACTASAAATAADGGAASVAVRVAGATREEDCAGASASTVAITVPGGVSGGICRFSLAGHGLWRCLAAALPGMRVAAVGADALAAGQLLRITPASDGSEAGAAAAAEAPVAAAARSAVTEDEAAGDFMSLAVPTAPAAKRRRKEAPTAGAAAGAAAAGHAAPLAAPSSLSPLLVINGSSACSCLLRANHSSVPTSGLPQPLHRCTAALAGVHQVDLILPVEAPATKASAAGVWHRLVTVGGGRVLGLAEWDAISAAAAAAGPYTVCGPSDGRSRGDAEPDAAAGAGCLRGLVFPRDFPDTPAWRAHTGRYDLSTQQSSTAAATAFAAYMRRPRAKRPDYVQLKAPAPFGPRWELLWPSSDVAALERVSPAATAAIAVAPLVMRGRDYVQGFLDEALAAHHGGGEPRDGDAAINGAASAGARSPAASAGAASSFLVLPSLTPFPTLLRVSIRLLHRGRLAEGDCIYLPTGDDVRQWQAQLRAVDTAGHGSSSLMPADGPAAASLPRAIALLHGGSRASNDAAPRSTATSGGISPAMSVAAIARQLAHLESVWEPLPVDGACTMWEAEEAPTAGAVGDGAVKSAASRLPFQDGHISLAAYTRRLLDPALAASPPSRALGGFVTGAVNTQQVPGVTSGAFGTAFLRAEAAVEAVGAAARLVGDGRALAVVWVRHTTTRLYRPALATVEFD